MGVGIFNFWKYDVLYFALAAVCAVIFVNGWTDAPNAVAACVGARSLSPRRAVALAAIFNLLGSLSVPLLGMRVARSVYMIADFGEGAGGLAALCAGMWAVTIWAVAAWYFGIPTSESHALLAAVSGAAVARGGIASFNPSGWGGVALGLALSTLPAVLIAKLVYFCIVRLFRAADRRAVLPGFIVFQRAGAAAGAFLHGLQDGQKFMGVIMLTLALSRGGDAADSFRLPWGVILLCGCIMAAGTAVGGGRIIKKVAFGMVSLDPPRGAAADVASAVCLVGCTTLGLPVSTTHARTCAVMGAGRSGANRGAVRDMIAAWLLTFPACGVLGYALGKIFLYFGG